MRFVKACIVIQFLFLLCFKTPAQESMSLLERRINCTIDSANVEQILEKIVTENDLFLSYNPEILPQKLCSVQLLNVPLEKILQVGSGGDHIDGRDGFR